jgi:nitrogen fixation protein FixH
MENNSSNNQPRRSWWPIVIVAYFACFLSACIAFVIYCSFHKVDLVSKDYYAQELRYQEQMERLARGLEVQGEVRIAYDAASQQMLIALPLSQARQGISGWIQLYRPSSASQDRQLALALNHEGVQTWDASVLEPGLWRVRVTWSVAHQQYYHDHKLIIPQRKT